MELKGKDWSYCGANDASTEATKPQKEMLEEISTHE